MYKALIRPLLFLMNPEQAHHFTLRALKFLCTIPGTKSFLHALFVQRHPVLERKLLGLTFPNPVGLAAGLDKDAAMIDELSCLGFGFMEIGTLTPRPQSGNEKPRLFRLPADHALINRMGFNNDGVEAAVRRLKKRVSNIIVGGNIGRNKLTANETAEDDYLSCVEALYPYVDYFVVNVSSPNTPGLRGLQEKGPLKQLLNSVKKALGSKEKLKPVLLKIAPDLAHDQLDDIVDIIMVTGTDGVIATNTTISREGLKTSQDQLKAIGQGGLSGAPLRDKSTEVVRYLRTKLGSGFAIIASGGVMTEIDALQKLEVGADLVQVYTGFVYEGPGLVKRICRRIAKL